MFQRLGPKEMARQSGMAERAIQTRRRRVEAKTKTVLIPPDNKYQAKSNIWRKVNTGSDVHGRINRDLRDGIIIAGSDAHIYPGPPSTAMRAFRYFVGEIKPKFVVLDGDVLDGTTISRHPPIGWEKNPTLAEEIEAAKEQLYEIEQASKNSEFIWPVGNHDSRFSVRLATVAPEYAGVHGVRLRDHFPRWKPCWSLHINPGRDSWTEILHNWKGGKHGSFNNAKDSGVNFVTGHDHAARVSPYTNRRGTSYGVNLGCLAAVDGDQFSYVQDRPKDWRSGFAILTYRDWRLMQPELVLVVDEAAGLVEYRTEIIKV